MTARLTQLRVADEGFLVSSMIERCPKVMMLRELVKNALEAASNAPPGAREVRLSAKEIEGVPKLAIRNSGRGMDADELFRMGDIASSIRKEHRLDQNFGMGAKVASLPSNRLGLRYRSCHDGIVHEVTLGGRDGVYGRLLRVGADGAAQSIADVTAEVLTEGYDCTDDWTEVVLFGNQAGQNTVLDPYGGQPPLAPHWIAEELHYRFFRIDADVALTLDASIQGNGRSVRFEPLAERVGRVPSRTEAVTLPDGIVLHYVYEPPLMTDASLFPPFGMCALLYRDELYDTFRWANWLYVAPVFGIPFVARAISVFIEIPDSYGVLPDGYRQFLRSSAGTQDPISCRGFAQAIHQHRPGWLIDIIDSHAPAAKVSALVYDDLNRLLRDLRVPRRRRFSDSPPAADVGPVQAVAGHLPATPEPETPVSNTISEDDAFEPSPEILMLRSEEEIHARGVHERAGRYYPETHQLFLNATYGAVTSMCAVLEQAFAWAPDQERVRIHALQLAEQSFASRVGRMLVFALSKQGAWHDHDMQQAISPHALSLAADDYTPSLPAANDSMNAMITTHAPTIQAVA